MEPKFLDRAEAAQYLSGMGLPVSKTTLQKWATVGGGPVYKRFGNRAVYTPDDLMAWAKSKLSEPHGRTRCAA